MGHGKFFLLLPKANLPSPNFKLAICKKAITDTTHENDQHNHTLYTRTL